jgi:epoxyqueuosine reductase
LKIHKPVFIITKDMEAARKYAERLGLWTPRFTLHDGKPLMICALPTGRGLQARPRAEKPVGSIAAFAQKNFYREMTERLRRLLRLLEDSGFPAGKSGCRIFCNSRLPEKEIALRAGLGAQGKNSLLVIPGAGSLFILGGIVFPEKFPGAGSIVKDARSSGTTEDLCKDCAACVRACPVQAISKGGRIDRGRCIQAYTANERMIPPDILAKWGITLYGCQICQEVCPHNRNAPEAAQTEYGRLGPEVPLENILRCHDEELRKNIFSGTVLDRTWISPLALKRNALIAAAHQKAVCLLPLIQDCARHTNPALRETAEWARMLIRGSPEA